MKNMCLFFFTLIFVLLIFELITRITYPLYADYNTEMWRYASQLKRAGTYTGLPHEHIPNTQADLYGAHVVINSDGLRDTEYSREKEAVPGHKPFRIIILGDSITFGWGVDMHDTFPELLEQRLLQQLPLPPYTTYNVLNMGVGNYNTAMETITLEKKGLSYNPDLVVLVYYINDVEPTSEKPFFLLRYSYLYAFLWDNYQQAKTKFIKGHDYQTYYKELYTDTNPGKEQAKQALLSLINITKEKNIPLVIAIVPELHQFKEYSFQEVTSFVTTITNEQNVPTIDLLPAFLPYAPETVWVSYEDAHPNALGHKIIAGGIYEVILPFLPLKTTISPTKQKNNNTMV